MFLKAEFSVALSAGDLHGKSFDDKGFRVQGLGLRVQGFRNPFMLFESFVLGKTERTQRVQTLNPGFLAFDHIQNGIGLDGSGTAAIRGTSRGHIETAHSWPGLTLTFALLTLDFRSAFAHKVV